MPTSKIFHYLPFSFDLISHIDCPIRNVLCSARRKKTLLGLIIFAISTTLFLASPVQAAYLYYYSDPFTTIDTTKWTKNGTLQGGGNGLGVLYDPGGSLISKVTVPDGTSDYEVRTNLSLGSVGNNLIHFLRATTDANYGPSAAGTYYAVVWQTTAYNSSTGQFTGTVSFYRRSGGVLQMLAYTNSITVTSPVVMRSVAAGNNFKVYFNGVSVISMAEGTIASGKPGVGVISGAGFIKSVDLGPLDRVAPPAIDPVSVSVSTTPVVVKLRWPVASDDANGIGVYRYDIWRNTTYKGTTTDVEYYDATVVPNTSYTYHLRPYDYHGNYSDTPVAVTTPPSSSGTNGSNDPTPLQQGVKRNGAYWGAGNEQINLLSGNLNFSLPLLKAQGRGGWGVPLLLTYNSKLWRKDSGGDWKLGKDVGYGFGWKLQAGSLTPVWSDPYTLHHYVFVDSTGAEYWLNVYNNGVWSSQEGLYIWYESIYNRLYFPDGSFWVMGCTSATGEQDSGTLYPTKIQDSNGNQVIVRYAQGNGASWVNSSARVQEIEDVRAVLNGGSYRTYSFTYNTDSIPHLTNITNYIGTTETFSFTYNTLSLSSPFTPPQSFGTTSVLQTVMDNLSLTHTFAYGANNSGELEKVTLPLGGYLRWAYQAFTYSGNVTAREVSNRYLLKAPGAAETNYVISHDPGDSSRPVRAWTTVDDPGGVGQKLWNFNTTIGSWQLGLLASLVETSGSGGTTLRQQDYTWTRDTANNPYVSAVLTTLDPGQSYQKQSKTEQTMDIYGNVTQSKVYEYGNLTTPVRTYTHSYLTGSNYTSRYIFNRRTNSTVNDGTQNLTLLTNTYDSYGAITDRYGIRQQDTVNYGTGFIYRGNVTTASSFGRSMTNYYDIAGTVTYTVDNASHSKTITVDSASNYAVPTVITPNTETNLATSLAYTSFLGVTTVTQPNNAQSRVIYDSYGRPSSSISVHGATTTYTYDYLNRTTTANINGRWTKTTTDGLGRTIKVEKGDGVGTQSVVDTEYDSCACSPLGKVKRVSQPYAPGGTVYWTTYTYDGLGRTTRIDLPNGGYTTFAFAGNATTTTDPSGKWKKHTYDSQGKLIKVTEPYPSGSNSRDTADYVYDILGRIKTVSVYGNGTTQTRTFTYDPTTQRLTSVTHPESGTTSYTYNADGTLATMIDAKNQKLAYVYDSFGRVTQIQHYPVSSGAEETYKRVNYYYDSSPCSNFTSQNAWGRVSAVTGPSLNCNTLVLTDLYFSYDASGLLAKKRMGAINSYLEAQYTYNNEGQVTSLSYPGTYEPGVGFNFGPVYNYYYDTMGRPNRMTLNGDTRDWVKDVVYGPAGEMAQMKYWYEYVTGADHYYSETLGYNSNLQLTSLDARTTPTNFTQPLVTQTYSYDLNGNVNQVVDSTASSTVNYTYDNLNRLSTAATASTAWGLSFTYDDFGNRTGQSVTKGSAPTSSLSISTTNNRITTSGYSYDNNGNLTAMPGSTMSYDIENRMTQITGSFGTENYKYGPDNNRIRKTRGTSIEHYYFYGAYGELLGVYAPYTSGGITYGNMTVERNVYFAGKLIRSKQTSSSGTVTDAAVVVDRLGSVRNRSNVNVSVNQGSTNYPFGEEIIGTDNNREKFATYFRDKDTGLDYARNRYYASTMGRFLTPDPYGGSPNSSRPGSWNRYAYTENSSVTYFDPNGLMIALPGGGGYGGGGGYWFEGGGACFQDIGGDIVYVPCAGPGRAPKDGEDAGGREGGGGNSSTPPNSPNPSSGSTVPPGMSQTFLSGFLKDFYSYVDATANSVTSKDGCLNLFFTSLMNKITGIPAGVGGEASAVFYGGLTFNRALQYALTTPSRTFGTDFLIYPYKSSVFRNMLKGSILVGWLAQLDIAAFQALIDEYEAALSGKCE